MRLTLEQVAGIHSFAQISESTLVEGFVVLQSPEQGSDVVRVTRDDGLVCWITGSGVILETEPKPSSEEDDDVQ